MAKDLIPITDMASAGLNTKDDPREIPPNQFPYGENIDIVQKGRILTRTGYGEWADTGGAGGMRGLLRFKRPFDTNQGDYMLSFGSDGKTYKSTALAPTPVDLGSYGVDSGPIRGIVFNNLAIFGNGLAGNALQKYDGGVAIANLGGSPPDANVFGTINNCLAVVSPATPYLLYWSDVGNPEVWGGGIANNTAVGAKADGQKVTAIIEANDQSTVFKENTKHPADVIFDNDDILARIAFKEKIDSSGGCIATGSVKSVANGMGEMVHYMSKDGFQGYGAIENFSNGRSPAELSWDIQPTVREVNLNRTDVINSEIFEKKYLCLAPLKGSQDNSHMFVRHIQYSAWTIYSGMNFADISTFLDADGKEVLIAASNAEPKLFIFNETFSDDGFGYNREYVSKIWTFSQATRWEHLDFEGVKTVGSTIFINIAIDGKIFKFKVTDKNLIQGLGGGYLGQNWTGKAYMGGGTYGTSTPLYRWRGRAKLGMSVDGFELQFNIFNQKPDEGWGANSYNIKFSPLNNDVAKTPRTQNLPYLEQA